MMSKNKTALMMYAASEHDSNLYYAVKFSVPDPFPYFRIGGRSAILMSDLELNRSQKQAKVDHVLSYSEFQVRARKAGVEKPGVADDSSSCPAPIASAERPGMVIDSFPSPAMKRSSMKPASAPTLPPSRRIPDGRA